MDAVFLVSFFSSPVLFLYTYLFINRFVPQLPLTNLPVYFIGVACFITTPLILLVLKAKLKSKYWKLFLFVYSAFIIIELVTLSIFREIYWYLLQDKKSVVLIILFSAALTLIVKNTNRITFVEVLKNLLKKISDVYIFKVIAYILVCLTIWVLVWDPKYKYLFVSIKLYGVEFFHAFHHVNSYLAPVYEILMGKTLLVNVRVSYGILSTYLNTIALKLIGFSYSNFVLYDMVATAAYCLLLFLFLKRVTKSFWKAFLGLLAFIKLDFFRFPQVDREIYIFPSTTPLRYFFDVAIAWLIWEYFRNRKNYRLFILLTLVVLASFFYNLDFGLLAFVAYILTISINIVISYFDGYKGRKAISDIWFYFLPLELGFIISTILLYAYTFWRSGQLIDWSLYFTYTSGMVDRMRALSIPLTDIYYLPLFIYLISFYLILYKIFQKKLDDIQVMIFLLLYGLFIFVYYLYLIELNHYIITIHPAIILFFVILGQFKNNFQSVTKLSFSRLFPTIFFFAVVLVVIFYAPRTFVQQIMGRLSYRYGTSLSDYHYWGYPGTDIYLSGPERPDFEIAMKVINRLEPGQKKIVILSRHDTLLYIMTQKTSLLNHPNIEHDTINFGELENEISQIKRLRPQYIFLWSEKYRHTVLEFQPIDAVWSRVAGDYQFQEHAGAVDVYKYKGNSLQ